MRASVIIGAAAVMTLAAGGGTQAAERRPAHPPAKAQAQAQAQSAERHATAAAYRTGPVGHGYSARDRHAADCLASYPGYDPATDRVRVRPGVTRRCDL